MKKAKKCRLKACKHTAALLTESNLQASALIQDYHLLESKLKAKLEIPDQHMRQLAIYERLSAAAATITESLAHIIMYGTHQG